MLYAFLPKSDADVRMTYFDNISDVLVLTRQNALSLKSNTVHKLKMKTEIPNMIKVQVASQIEPNYDTRLCLRL